MGKVIVLGEALIDFVSKQTGIGLSAVSEFVKSPGGAPANVAACVSKLGGKSQIITKLGKDPFGDYLVETMQSIGIDCSSVYRTDLANTALAFVSLKDNGQRDFLFYRKPSADLLLSPDEVDEKWFEKGDIFHFCSVNLAGELSRKAHDKALEIAKSKGVLVSFDPNVRLPLWEDSSECKKMINQYIPLADILKISNDELEFVTGEEQEDVGLQKLKEQVKMLVYTKGADGAEIYVGEKKVKHGGFKVNVVDTTGAGDSFIGAMLYRVSEYGSSIEAASKKLEEIAAFANATASILTMRKGAINSMACLEEVKQFMLNN